MEFASEKLSIPTKQIVEVELHPTPEVLYLLHGDVHSDDYRIKPIRVDSYEEQVRFCIGEGPGSLEALTWLPAHTVMEFRKDERDGFWNAYRASPGT
ncbi:MAG TPA: hypothetical protein H9867_02885 [Candidatus Corynebacterium gallistercoris]|uniref:Uncharacterized protein n=1 Tax=Candidatus Corynebacterium gallistercoris TaxID=2838530 RepID=A0A9D1RY47_9CORY|nr:hypothetical protein [Candidatus Corynebacterium gallistercoris]